MKFSRYTLISTSNRFSDALRSRGLDLGFSTCRNVWCQIALGKNFSSAVAQADANTFVNAVPASEESIRAALIHRSRDIDTKTAGELFAEAIREDLAMLSTGMDTLVRLIGSDQDRCLVEVTRDSTRLGLMDSGNPGYLPISNLGLPLTEQDVAWLRGSAPLAMRVLNSLSGLNTEQHMRIFASNHRASTAKADEVFAESFHEHIDLSSTEIAEALLQQFRPTDVKDWDVDIDVVRDTIFDVVFEIVSAEKKSWFSPECELAEAMIDHLALRVRETLKWLSDLANDDDEDPSPAEHIAHTARLSMQKVLNTRQRK
jgi:hypothetical protein